MAKNIPFWKRKSLPEMTTEEWESLCDGCAKCCLIKLEDESTNKVFYTQVACQYLDEGKCRCRRYEKRSQLVPDCVWLKPEDIDQFHWLPKTCAYRLISEGKELMWWHPLVSGDRDTVHEAGISVRDKVISEEFVHSSSYEEHIIKWVEF